MVKNIQTVGYNGTSTVSVIKDHQKKGRNRGYQTTIRFKKIEEISRKNAGA